MSEISGKP